MPDKILLPGDLTHHIEGDTDDDEQDSFKEFLRDDGKSDKTIHDYTSYVRGFYARSDRESIIDLADEPDHIKDDMLAYIGSQATEYGLKAYLKWWMRYGDRDAAKEARYIKDLIHGTGASDASVDEVSRLKRKIIPTGKVRAIIEHAPEYTNTFDPGELRLMLRCMYQTASRSDGMLRWQWQDVLADTFGARDLQKLESATDYYLEHDVDKGAVPVEVLIRGERSKSKATGVVYVFLSTYEELLQHRPDDASATDHVFFPDIEDRERAYKRLRYCFNKAAAEDAYEPAATTHWFRHSRLTNIGKRMLGDGHSYAEVKSELQRYARHQDAATTETYIDVLKDLDDPEMKNYLGSTVEE